MRKGKGMGNEGPTRRDLLKLGSAALGSMAVSRQSPGSPLARTTERDNRPNFVIFMTDGQRADEMSIAGNKIIHTPHIDRIGQEGMRFQNAFVVNALCAPSRATVLTGMYSRKHGVIDNKNRTIATDMPIISDLLREAGYEVAFCGKSHVKGALRDHYWDYYFGPVDQPDYLNPRIAEGVNGKIRQDQVYPGYVDDLLTQASVEWLLGRREKPFCLFLWLYAPHRPFIRPRRHADLYNGVFIPKPSTFDDDLKNYPGKPQAFARAENKIGVFEDVRTLEALVKDHYATTVDADENIGRLLDALSQSGKLDDTAVFFTADHGFFLGEWHIFDKRLMHEPSIRIPLLIRYPKLVNAGSLSEKMVLNLDIAPTVLELAGLKVPATMQGRSLVSLLKGENLGWREDWLYAYYEYPGDHMVAKNRGIRTERYKLIEYYEEEPMQYELYDLQADPSETQNLYGHPEYASLATKLLQRLEEVRAETGEG
jgi:arylsulfatase A-like enzyme